MKLVSFALEISVPDETLKNLAVFFQEHTITIDKLKLHRYRNGDASVVIHCEVEEESVDQTVALLKEVIGVINLVVKEEKKLS